MPQFKAVLDLGRKAKACNLVFRSPIWQMHNIRAYTKLKLAVRLFVDGEKDTLVRTMADAAWYNLKLSFLTPFAQLLQDPPCKLPPECNGNLCVTVFHMTKKVLKLSDQEAMMKVAKRFQVNDAMNMYLEDLLELDECLEVLDGQDAKKVNADQKKGARGSGGHPALRGAVQGPQREAEVDRPGQGEGEGRQKATSEASSAWRHPPRSGQDLHPSRSVDLEGEDKVHVERARASTATHLGGMGRRPVCSPQTHCLQDVGDAPLVERADVGCLPLGLRRHLA